MWIESISGTIQIQAPAKLNLFLEITDKRADGFHEIESLMCPISLCDHFEFTSTREADLHLQLDLPANTAVSGPANDSVPGTVLSPQAPDPAWDIPSDSRNLVMRAVAKVRESLRIQAGCRMRLQKSIPAAAGLGGGSSDAAAAVVAAMLGWSRWDRPLATQICAELGSDLNLFLGDEKRIGISLAKGRGESCEVLSARPEFCFIVTHPPAGCSTSAVYAGWRKGRPVHSVVEFAESCKPGQVDRVGALLHNALEPSASAITPWIDRQLRFFQDCGFRYNAMTGSGSSCFALVSQMPDMAYLRRAAADAGLSRVYAVKSWSQPSIEEQLERMSSS